MYRSIVFAHVAFGVLALATYWIAALGRKGSPLHKGAGKAYLLGMLGIVVSSIYLSAQAFLQAKPVIGTFLAYLVVITATAMWLGWTSIRRKREQSRFRDPLYIGMALINVASGLIVFAFGLKVRAALLMGFSWIGILLGAQMLWRAWKPLDEAKWWLREHIGAMLGCGVATHVAFLSIGMRRVTEALGIEADLGLLPWFLPVAVSIAAGIWLDRKYLGRSAVRLSPGAVAGRGTPG